MALASFEQPSESHAVFDFLGGSGRLQRTHYYKIMVSYFFNFI